MEKTKESLVLNDKIKFDNKGGAILGVLEGPVADFINSTRNGRHYGEQLWENVFNNDIIKEQFSNGGILGELDHPKDRDDICTEKVAIIMPEPPVKNKNGEYIGKFNILDTPCGRIVYTLAKAGFRLGVSSRGNGDYDEYTGEVDPDSYDFTCFDVVVLPAVKDARMKLVTESFDKNTSFKKLLTEQLERSSDEDKAIMKETLENLKENLDNPQEQANFKKEHPEWSKEFDFNKYGKYFDKDGKLVDEKGYFDAIHKLGELGKTIKEAYEKHKCILCGKEFDGWGNNAWPIKDGICCDKCNAEKVIPARIAKLYKKEEPKMTEDFKYIGNAKIISTLPKVGEPYGHENELVIKVDKKGSKDGYTIYDIVAQDKDSRDKKLGDNVDVSHWEVAVKEQLNEEKEIPDITVKGDTLTVDIDKEPEVEITDGEKEPCEEFDSKLKEFLDRFLETQDLETEGEEEKDLFVKLFHETFPEVDCYAEKHDDIDDEVEDGKEDSSHAAKDTGAEEDVELLEQFQKALKENKSLKEEIRKLQAEQAVGNTKVTKLNEELEKFKLLATNAGKKALSLRDYSSENAKLKDKLNALNESLSKANKISIETNSQKDKVQESLDIKTKENKSLKEKLDSVTKSSRLIEEKYQKSIKLVEKYKQLAHEIANRYIDNKALALGVSSNEIKNRLNESYTLDEVDEVCEQIQGNSLKLDTLPFMLSKSGATRAKLRENRERDPLKSIDSQYDDSVDDYLLDLAGLKK